MTQPMLREVFAPITDELDVVDLEITGNVPAALEGAFIRNGPNQRFEPLGRYHMFDGDGMLHSLTLRDGHAVYRNRWIRTAALAAEERAGRALYGGLGEMHFPTREEVGDAGNLKNPANTNIVRHAGRYLALWEGGLPTEVTASLDTVGTFDFDGRLSGAFTAHPRIDPRTGEMFAFAYQPFAPYLRAFHISPNGELVKSVDLDRPSCSVMHDFVITENHVIFVESPLVFDLAGALEGRAPFNWEADHGTHVGVMARGGDHVDWIEVTDGYVNHFWNAWEEHGIITFSGSSIVGTSYTSGEGGAADGGDADSEPGRPTRYRVDLANRTATSELIDDLGGDYPRINDAYLGIRSRFHTMSAFGGRADIVGHFDTIVQYDDHTDARTSWYAGAGTIVGEAVFAADPDGTEENDGWLLFTVHDRATGATDLAVMDAHDVAAGPIARVHFPRRLPFGFHAGWFPDVPATSPAS